MKYLIAATLLLLPLNAHAQTSTTTCMNNGAYGTTCTTTAPQQTAPLSIQQTYGKDPVVELQERELMLRERELRLREAEARGERPRNSLRRGLFGF